MSCESRAIDQLRESGVRLTPQRAMVLEAIYHNDGHLSVDEVHERVQQQSPYVDLSTIYRTVMFLKQQGVIGELRLDGQPVRYEAVRYGKEHHHAVCSTCGAMIEIDSVDMQELSDILTQKYGFAVNLIHLTLTGQCAACQAISP
ncbi:MAG: transcriptional repressor [Anaerolineae bacterium]|nr:transcriptional repressor [Anaerolineae bacterium]MCB9130021.1 transcriptional repressor [Anaerolineales bacterium]MCB0228279.1 transcriptional repressor [Anaerolineae bacterium]MCB0237877.1 transcriptional repressor [Anaerolineae bacterium]MCB0244101.1 transcriptional repressor [Anaerolineae bacterium]